MTHRGRTKRWAHLGDYDHLGHLNRFQKQFARKKRARDDAEAAKSLDESSGRISSLTERFTADRTSVK
jgi:hypothetical protein